MRGVCLTRDWKVAGLVLMLQTPFVRCRIGGSPSLSGDRLKSVSIVGDRCLLASVRPGM